MAVIVGGVVEKEGKFLLVQEAQKKCYGKWNIPAGHLDPNETIFEGAQREIFEETGCKVKVKELLEISNRVIEDDIFLGIVFSTEIIEENINYDKNEILDVKWFTYEEIMNMKEELRSYYFITNAITRYVEGKKVDLDLFNVID